MVIKIYLVEGILEFPVVIGAELDDEAVCKDLGDDLAFVVVAIESRPGQDSLVEEERASVGCVGDVVGDGKAGVECETDDLAVLEHLDGPETRPGDGAAGYFARGGDVDAWKAGGKFVDGRFEDPVGVIVLEKGGCGERRAGGEGGLNELVIVERVEERLVVQCGWLRDKKRLRCVHGT